MGMDVSGLAPKNESGVYFRANIWSWRPIYELMCDLCGDIIDDETLAGMSHNQGDGVKSQEICDEIALRFTIWMASNGAGHSIDSTHIGVREDGRLVTGDAVVDEVLKSPYWVEHEHLEEWVTFLRNCGGFEVW